MYLKIHKFSDYENTKLQSDEKVIKLFEDYIFYI